MFAVIVTMEAVPGRAEDLIKALENNAAHSREEKACLRWEWSRHIAESDRFAIYELYVDEAAFEVHKASPHFAEWRKATEGVLASKTAGYYHVVGADSR